MAPAPVDRAPKRRRRTTAHPAPCPHPCHPAGRPRRDAATARLSLPMLDHFVGDGTRGGDREIEAGAASAVDIDLHVGAIDRVAEVAPRLSLCASDVRRLRDAHRHRPDGHGEDPRLDRVFRRLAGQRLCLAKIREVPRARPPGRIDVARIQSWVRLIRSDCGDDSRSTAQPGAIHATRKPTVSATTGEGRKPCALAPASATAGRTTRPR